MCPILLFDSLEMPTYSKQKIRVFSIQMVILVRCRFLDTAIDCMSVRCVLEQDTLSALLQSTQM